MIKFPQKQFLSADELMQYKNQDAISGKHGSKRLKFEGTDEEKLEVQEMLSNLKRYLLTPKIDRICGRSKAQWCSDGKIKLLKKEGKFQSFGYALNGQEYLNIFETIFLIELNRLELYWNDVLVSLEQAYTLLLGEEKSKNYDKQLVFSTLSRSGYIVRIYENSNYSSYSNHNVIQEVPNKQDCLWEILLESLNPEHVIPKNIGKESNFNSIKNSFNHIKEITRNNLQLNDDEITGECSSAAEIVFNQKICTKRKASDYNDRWNRTISKKRKIDDQNNDHGSLLDILKNEPQYKEFEHIFQSFGTFELARDTIDSHDSSRNLEISFDLFIQQNENFKKSNPNQPPNLRLIILNSSEEFPKHNEIEKCFDAQKFKVPVIVITISESKHIQGFLYYVN